MSSTSSPGSAAAGIPFTLAPREVHVWHAGLNDLAQAGQLPALAALLNAEEHTRVARFHFSKDRDHFTLARGILRGLLAGYCGVPAAAIALAYSTAGKPALAWPAGVDLHFNLSHSHGLAVYAFARGFRVGIDVELVRELKDADQIVERFFSPAELAAYRALAPDARPQGFFNGWVGKEAFVKALGQGLGHELAAFTVSLTPGAPARLVALPADQAGAGWTLCAVPIDPSYACAVVGEGGTFQVKCRRWP
jgi:4'-phosphopantetheinyl transferase